MTKKVKVKQPKKSKKSKEKKMPNTPITPKASPLVRATVPETVTPKGSFKVKNIGGSVAKELKPGIGVFTLQPGETITVDSKEVADSLVNDSGGFIIHVA